MPKTQGHTLTYETRHYMDALASTTSIQHTMAQRHALPQHTRQYTETHRHTHSRLDHNALVAHVVSIPEDADLAANPNQRPRRRWWAALTALLSARCAALGCAAPQRGSCVPGGRGRRGRGGRAGRGRRAVVLQGCPRHGDGAHGTGVHPSLANLLPSHSALGGPEA